MNRFTLFAGITLILAVFNVNAQTDNSNTPRTLESIDRQISRISTTLEELNKRLATFAETFNSNQGLRLTERQQKLLFAFEFLNRAETRISTLKTLKIQLVEKENATRNRINEIDESLRQENLDRSLRGTTNSESIRENMRRTLTAERNSLTNLLNEITTSINEIDSEIRQTELVIKNLRQRIFPEIYKEFNDL